VSLHELGKPMLSVDGDDDSAACVDLDGSLEIADPHHGAGVAITDSSHHAHQLSAQRRRLGKRTVIIVPSPRELVIENVPPPTFARSCIIRIP